MINIGSNIGGYEITAMARGFVLAEHSDKEVPDPFAVWHIDADGMCVWGGRYFTQLEDAEWDFCASAFEWFEDNMNINMIEEDEEEPPAPAEKKSFINKDFDEAVDKMVEELNERKGKENAPEGEAPEQVKANLRKAIVRYGVPKEVILDDGTAFYSAKRYNELNFLSTYQAIAEIWTRMLISSNSKVIRTVIKEICEIKNLKGKPFAREIHAAYEEMIHHNFYKR